MRRLAGRYEIQGQVGKGGVGSVSWALDHGVPFERHVCIKRLLEPLDVGHAKALREEARLLALVRHANVVTLLALEEDADGSPFLVLERICGCDLRALCEHTLALAKAKGRLVRSKGPRALLPDRVAVHIACAVLRGLAAVQRALPGLVHRDVSPHNVLVSNEGEVKLTDFGIALARDRERWTRPRYVKGKFGYMSPEQIRGDALDVRSDIFAVGVVLYELLTGSRPCATEGHIAELRKIEAGEWRSLAETRPALDRSLLEAMSHILAHDPRSRFPNADDAVRALAPHAAGDLGALRLAEIVRTMEYTHSMDATPAYSMEAERTRKEGRDGVT